MVARTLMTTTKRFIRLRPGGGARARADAEAGISGLEVVVVVKFHFLVPTSQNFISSSPTQGRIGQVFCPWQTITACCLNSKIFTIVMTETYYKTTITAKASLS
jgi:hypothetical protein